MGAAGTFEAIGLNKTEDTIPLIHSDSATLYGAYFYSLSFSPLLTESNQKDTFVLVLILHMMYSRNINY